jgi:hypothetical protein
MVEQGQGAHERLRETTARLEAMMERLCHAAETQRRALNARRRRKARAAAVLAVNALSPPGAGAAAASSSSSFAPPPPPPPKSPRKLWFGAQVDATRISSHRHGAKNGRADFPIQLQ